MNLCALLSDGPDLVGEEEAISGKAGNERIGQGAGAALEASRTAWIDSMVKLAGEESVRAFEDDFSDRVLGIVGQLSCNETSDAGLGIGPDPRRPEIKWLAGVNGGADASPKLRACLQNEERFVPVQQEMGGIEPAQAAADDEGLGM
jgi:hypothetical protein